MIMATARENSVGIGVGKGVDWHRKHLINQLN